MYLLLLTWSATPIRSSRKRGQTIIPLKRESSHSELDHLIKTLHLKSVPSGGISFLAPLHVYHTEKPYLSRLPSGTSLPRTNLVTSNQQLDIFEVSGHESSFTLAESGFEYAKSSVQVHLWNDTSVCLEYIPQMEQWLKKYLDCARVLIYAYNMQLRHHVFAGCSSFSHSSIWRPITTPHQDSPLALCDYRSLNPDKDLVSADIIFPHYRDEAYEVLYNPNQRWFYKKGMEWDDVILFKLGDSKADEAQRKDRLVPLEFRIDHMRLSADSSVCPHSAFMDPSVPTGTPARRSIEIRAMIIG
ncbi:hypothetical protein DL98DRAFT_422606 [Cadophora sp. DSE1049]|nr:hypothetical protein DL98DRAFT_422606 [Cadophora sp. DSE1049]